MNQPPKKRRFTFSLRTLMVFMLVVGVLLGLVGRRVHRAREQQAFLQELEASGWNYSFDGGHVSSFWKFVLDSSDLDRIKSVIYEAYAKDELDISKLLELKNLYVLRIDNKKVSDLSPLAELKNLKKT